MSGGYYYLVASLPLMHFGEAPKLASGPFLSRCATQVSAAHYAMLAGVELVQSQPQITGLALLDRWHDHERALRNALAVARAQRLGIEPTAHLRHFRPHPALAGFAQQLLALDSPLAADEALDRRRWQFLEELAFGHYFDLEILVIYRLKVLLLERRARFDPAMGAARLDRWLTDASARSRATFTPAGN